MKTTICLIRHGQTDWNKAKLIQGRLNNKLNDTGRLQVKEAGLLLKKYDPSWDLIVTSPLDRAKESAKIIMNALEINIPIIENKEVIEREFGKAEGCNITPEIYDLILKDEIEGLEKSFELQKRAYLAILDIAEKYEGKKILVTTHSHFIKGLFTYLSKDISFISPLGNASLNYVEVEDGKITNYIFNKNKF